MAERNEAKLRKIKLKVPVMDSAERAEKSPPPSQLQSDAGLSDFKKRKREKDDDDGSDHDEKQRRTSNIQSKSKPVSQRGIAPKAKPKPSKKSAAHKNNKLKKRHSTVGGETATPTPEPEDRSTEPAVEGDYTKTKTVQNQIPIQQFWGFVDQFFRPVNEADLAFLDNEGDEVAPYSIPPLGRPYKEQWAEEDSKGGSQSNGILMAANGQTQDGEICYKPISERIISSLMENRIIGGVFAPVAEETVDEPLTPESMGDAIDLEDRMRKELRFLGLIEDEEDNATPDEHDEITTELRHRQRELREQVHRNRSRRRQMKAIATRFMAWQEYNGVLDDINKSIEQAYIKRFTPAKTKGKKKVSKGDYRPMTENVMQLLHNRQRIIKELGALLPPSQFTIPETSIFTA
ncbi:histone acetyltransferases subunit 3-domain-containing protein [Fimicolochytrium jonesii]|uniref:histone acetyltransferases subunit 3-domain-containing protein n=1 Tax=Fimicolochytrium jonesii TaxID=1396493 RepID=UPI0022FE4A90|nr:histone acetyltransferases subunit 3-domain-containing protein [Fimicolochytrium jonesii]KAI8817689.1 histone acetyltransferases subunit 3-domain-containing protein [Fimicolochytrium jonesii]